MLVACYKKGTMDRLLNDIPVQYVNKTGRHDFAVAVFVKNHNPNAFDTPYVAWHILRTQTAAKFVYPIETQVGAEYAKDGATLTAGPITAKLGSTWELHHESPDLTPYLKEGEYVCIHEPLPHCLSSSL